MSRVLYRKYRSQSLAEIVGQEHITDTLAKALKSNKVSHAYLFTGPRGTGKTSVARILAHEINGLEYGHDLPHLDIIEIDAASNRKIDEIRDLRDKVHIAPTTAKYKVYIIDEVHMLTKEAFNALLKTLEEPPEHCIFILATTELHKVPETIQSRTQKFTFKLVDKQKVVAHLKSLADKEEVEIEEEALELIAEHGGGSFRDSISLLDQLASSHSKISLSDVESVIGRAPVAATNDLLKAALEKDVVTVLEVLEDLESQGAEASQVAKQLIDLIKQRLKKGELNGSFLSLLEELLLVSSSQRPDVKLQIALLKVAADSHHGDDGTKATVAKLEVSEPSISEPVRKKDLKASKEDVEAPISATDESASEASLLILCQ